MTPESIQKAVEAKGIKFTEVVTPTFKPDGSHHGPVVKCFLWAVMRHTELTDTLRDWGSKHFYLQNVTKTEKGIAHILCCYAAPNVH